MDNQFFEHPILNSPYEYPGRHWELDSQGQPTQQIVTTRRIVEFITPIPKPKKQKATQEKMIFDEGKGLSSAAQQYDPTPIINELRVRVDQWRALPDSKDWLVTPETARLLHHWRHHPFSSIRPFFCQVEAAETAIWLTEVAPKLGKSGKSFLEHLENAIRTQRGESVQCRVTAERVLVHADTSVHPDLLNSRFGYVSISRASHEAALFTDDMTKLGPQLAAEVSKTSALEVSPAPSIVQGIGMM